MTRKPPPLINIPKELAALERMGPTELRAKHLEVFGEPTHSGNRPFLIKRIAWRLQANAEGGLSERARQRARELAHDADIRVTTPRSHPVSARIGQVAVTGKLKADSPELTPGTVLTRPYRGRMIRATVLDNGFDYEGHTFRSLSAIARAATGTRWNGRVFFGLKGKE